MNTTYYDFENNNCLITEEDCRNTMTGCTECPLAKCKETSSFNIVNYSLECWCDIYRLTLINVHHLAIGKGVYTGHSKAECIKQALTALKSKGLTGKLHRIL